MEPFEFIIHIFSGDVGGQMGLFIGCSTLTLLEAFDYFYDIIKVLSTGLQEYITVLQAKCKKKKKFGDFGENKDANSQLMINHEIDLEQNGGFNSKCIVTDIN